jgi:assimilatory nitrate reductase catalytic subunit
VTRDPGDHADLHETISTRTHCPYCALQCGLRVSGMRSNTTVSGDDTFPVNAGALCIKGWTSAVPLAHPDRLTTPLVRNQKGQLVSASWPEAIERVASAFRTAIDRYGKDGVGIYGSGSLTNEKVYALGKFARMVLGTSNIDYNGRFCMSSAASAALRAFGIDRGLPFPLTDIPAADLVLLVGSNPAETMPPFMQYLEAQQRGGGRLVVIDPRTTLTARAATLHLRLAPGSDAALANGLLHLLIRDHHIDEQYIRSRTEGFESVRAFAATYWPERVERLTGISHSDLLRTVRLIGSARSVMVLTARGPEQQAQGVGNTLAWINVALALGMVGRPHAGWGCLTGQGNGQGGREHGQKADQLPGYRRLDDTNDRAHIAALWGIDPIDLPAPGRSAYELLASMGRDGGIRAMLVMGSNVLVSAPHARHIESRLRALDTLVVVDFFRSETAELADVVLPSAQWAEEDGTMTNLEGRVIRRRRAMTAPTGVKTDIEILRAMADALGFGAQFAWDDAQAVFDELRQATAGGPADYSGITYDRIDRENGVFWPCPSEGHPGTPRLFTDPFPTPSGRARFHVVRHQLPAEEPDDEYPLYLTTGRLLAQYQSGTQTRRIDRLQSLAPAAAAEIHPAVARRHGIADGDLVRLTTRRGEILVAAKVTPAIREDTVFVAFHWGGTGSVNRLTNPVLDPISRMPEFKVCAVRVERAREQGPGTTLADAVGVA